MKREPTLVEFFLKNRLIALLVFSTVTACAHRAKQLPESEPQAVVKFGPALGVEGIAAFWYDNDQCVAHDYSGVVGTFSWIAGREGSTTIPVGKPIYVMQFVSDYAGGCGGFACVRTKNCTSMTSFIPVAGKRYHAEALQIGDHCVTQLSETTSVGEILVKGQQAVSPCNQKNK